MKTRHRAGAKRQDKGVANRTLWPTELKPHVKAIDERYQFIPEVTLEFLTAIVFVNYFNPKKFRHKNGRDQFLYSRAAYNELGKNYVRLLSPIFERGGRYNAGTCKPGILTPAAIEAVENYRLSTQHATMNKQSSGKVASRDINGNKSVARFELNPAIPGRVDDVYGLWRFLQKCIDKHNGWGGSPNDLAAYMWFKRYNLYPSENSDIVESLHRQAATVVNIANSYPYPAGAFPSLPIETSTGRIIYQEPSLQNTRSVIRDCFLGGNYDVDISTAHPGFALQAANQNGTRLPFLKEYVANKSALRTSIAEKVGITIPTVKRAITAVAYGAPRTTAAYYDSGAMHQGAILDMIAAEHPTDYRQFAEALFLNPEFKGIADDLQKSRHAVVNQLLTPVEKSKYAHNVIGKRIAKTEALDSLNAHALQGMESKFLHVAYQVLKSNILLLMHDGFVTGREADLRKIEGEFHNQTGFRITLEQERIPTLREF